MTHLRSFSNVLLSWYDLNKRSLPWRETKDPYAIWLSEVILQQTRVEQGRPYFEKFITTFPDVHQLAGASESKVLRLWEGLGYYSRGRNLHKCAREIVKRYSGAFPQSHSELITLPGIGPYTAAAVSSIAFDERVPVVDGNVYRVLSRIFGIDTDISSPAARKLFTEKAASLTPETRTGDFNQAMMEFGAIQCTPRNPKCDSCPFHGSCVARRQDMISLLPVKVRRPKVTTRFFNYFVLQQHGKVGMKRRDRGDIWEGLYDFHLVITKGKSSLNRMVKQDLLLQKLKKSTVRPSGTVRHVLTHQVLHIHYFVVNLEKENLTMLNEHMKPFRFISTIQARRLPKPVPIKAWLEQMAE